jgi:hypothetical protein
VPGRSARVDPRAGLLTDLVQDCGDLSIGETEPDPDQVRGIDQPG